MRRTNIIPIAIAAILIFVVACESPPQPVSQVTTISTHPSTTPLLDSDVRITFINVSQGDATLITGHSIADPFVEAILIDCGAKGKAQKVIDTLKKNNVTELQIMYITNPDADHMGACVDIINAMRVRGIYTSDVEKDTDTYHTFQDMVSRYGHNHTLHQDDIGEVIDDKYYQTQFYGYFNMSFIVAYDTNNNLDTTNDRSIMLWMQRGAFSTYFPGDCEKACESELIKTKNILTPITVLKAGHHGSTSSSNPSFLDYLAPKILAISSAGGCPYGGCTAANSGNRYGHPRSEVIKNAELRNIQILRTDFQGDYTITIDRDGNYAITTEK